MEAEIARLQKTVRDLRLINTVHTDNYERGRRDGIEGLAAELLEMAPADREACLRRILRRAEERGE